MICNSVAEHLGYSREEFAKLTITEFELQPNQEETRRNIAAICATKRDAFRALDRVRDGTPRPVFIEWSLVSWLGREVMPIVYREVSSGDERGPVEKPAALPVGPFET